jgi:hypothetical protein
LNNPSTNSLFAFAQDGSLSAAASSSSSSLLSDAVPLVSGTGHFIFVPEEDSGIENDSDSIVQQEEDATSLASPGSQSHYLDNCAPVEAQFKLFLNINESIILRLRTSFYK